MLESLQMDREEMVLRHTEETGVLRRRIQHLLDQVESMPAPMSAQPSSAGLSDFTSDMDNLTMGHGDWDNFIFSDTPEAARHNHNYARNGDKMASFAKGPEGKKSQSTPEQPVASGILFMLLLCGAFVASRSSSRPIIPRMPDEVRAASSTVLDTLLKDSKPDRLPFGPTTSHSLAAVVNAEPAPSHPPSNWYPQQMHQQDRAGAIHRSMTEYSKAQEADQVFSLTPAEYNALTSAAQSADEPHGDATITHNRRNLAESLANLRQESITHGSNTAEVYTRSLLWDQIPADVVKQFKELVSESRRSNEAATRGQEQGTSASNTQGPMQNSRASMGSLGV